MKNSVSDIFSERCNHCQGLHLLNRINDALVLVEAENGKIIFMNDKALAMYQYTNEESLKLSIVNISHNSFSTIRKNGQVAKRYANGYIFTTNHVKKDGSIFKVEASTCYMKFHGHEIFAAVVRNLTSSSKMQEEVELAGNVQRRLLPRDLDRDLFRICSIYQPHNYVSGDLYDFAFDANKNLLYGILIDVMGHGIAAAFQTNILKDLFIRAMRKNIPINDKLAWMNKELMPFFAGEGFAGAFLFEFDFKCNTLTYSAGGINKFIVRNIQGTQIVQAPGLFLGINGDETFDQGVYHFESGQSFLFLTDGLFELISQPINTELDFWGMYEMCKNITASGKCRDDASSVGILIR